MLLGLDKLFLVIRLNFILPSDSTKREDLIALAKGDLDDAQSKKEKLEQIQRDDLKRREDYIKKMKK